MSEWALIGCLACGYKIENDGKRSRVQVEKEMAKHVLCCIPWHLYMRENRTPENYAEMKRRNIEQAKNGKKR